MQLSAIVYEVRNTFGGLHTYVLPIENGQVSDAGVRQNQSKQFYVSPFISMEQHYHFRMLPPAMPSGSGSSKQTPKARFCPRPFRGPARR